MGTIGIREGSFEDIDKIYDLQRRWLEEGITYGFSPTSKEYLEKKLGRYFFIAEYENIVVGFIYGTIHTAKDISIFIDGEKYIEIDDVYISAEHRSSGIGGMLADKLLDTARKDGVERALVYSATKDFDSIVKFYKKPGSKLGMYSCLSNKCWKL
jgi:ribosomal protein S18 acetylase RimI-like enzyme